MNTTAKSLLIASTVTAVVTAFLVFLFSNPELIGVWNSFEVGTNGWWDIFCEAPHMDSVIRQPANTWSNLAYLFVGVFFVSMSIYDYKAKFKRAFIMQFPLFSGLMGVSCIYLSFGSFFYHASLLDSAQIFDMGGVIACTSVPLVYFIFRLYHLYNRKKSVLFFKKRHRELVTFIFILVAMISYMGWTWRPIAFSSVAITLGIIYYTYWKYKIIISYKKLFLALGLLALSWILWFLDVTDTICNSSSLFQLHAIWHIMTATGLGVLFSFFRSEKI